MFEESLKTRRLSACLAAVFALSLLQFGFSPPLSPNKTTLISICRLQGAGSSSSYTGKSVSTRGVVFLDLDETSRRGFYIQSESCDSNPATSDGIFVYLGERIQKVATGDLVEVSGVVDEYFGKTEIAVSPDAVVVLSIGNPLPAPQDLDPPFEPDASSRYLESLEDMHVRLSEAVAVGPTDASGQTWIVHAGRGIERVFRDDPRGFGEIVCADDGGLNEINPQARVGDRVQSLQGALDYTVGEYCIQLNTPPVLIPLDGQPPWKLSLSGDLLSDSTFTLATFNLKNLFDTSDDPFTDDTVLSAAEYQRRLQKRALAIHTCLGEPAILALQEVENLVVLQALVSRPEIESDYGIVWEDGPDRRGLDVALLYRKDLVELLDFHTEQGCTSLVDGLGPDGNGDPANPTNAITCDMDGNGDFEGNRLFSRPPLLAHFRLFVSSGPVEIRLIANHWKSKTEDSDVVEVTLPRRTEQAQFVASLVRELLGVGDSSGLIVLGDLNDYPTSQPLSILYAHGLQDLWPRVEQSGRYSYVYQGVSQVLDHFLFYPALSMAPVSVAAIHINADFPAVFEGVAASPYRSSDHDPLLIRFQIFDHFTFIPLAFSLTK